MQRVTVVVQMGGTDTAPGLSHFSFSFMLCCSLGSNLAQGHSESCPGCVLWVIGLQGGGHSANSEVLSALDQVIHFAPFQHKAVLVFFFFGVFHCTSALFFYCSTLWPLTNQMCDQLELPSICLQHLWSSARLTIGFLVTSPTKTRLLYSDGQLALRKVLPWLFQTSGETNPQII